MDANISKTKIITAETVMNETAEQPIDVDFTLPDYYPDVEKILKCRLVNRISGKGINGNTLTVDGTATLTVIYCDPDNALNAYEYQFPFSKNFDYKNDEKPGCITASAETEYINCRAVSGRKIDIHGAISVCAVVSANRENEIISDIEDENVETLKGFITTTSPIVCSEKYMSVDEELEIGNGNKDINCIIRYDATPSIKESKLLGGKAVISGETQVNILYCDNEGEIRTHRDTIPFSQILEMSAASENCECEAFAQIAFLEIKPKVSGEDPIRAFLMTARILITCKAVCTGETAVLLDAFSRKCQLSLTREKLTLQRICEKINDSFSARKTAEMGGESVVKIIDIFSDVKTVKTEFNDNVLKVCGTAAVCIITENAEGKIVFCEKDVDYSFERPCENCGENLFAKPEITVSATGYTLNAEGNIELNLTLNINAAVFERSAVSLITEAVIDPEKPCEKPPLCALSVCFCCKGENIWEIAKKYFADINEIKRINNLENDVLTEDKMIIVPSM